MLLRKGEEICTIEISNGSISCLDQYITSKISDNIVLPLSTVTTEIH